MTIRDHGFDLDRPETQETARRHLANEVLPSIQTQLDRLSRDLAPDAGDAGQAMTTAWLAYELADLAEALVSLAIARVEAAHGNVRALARATGHHDGVNLKRKFPDVGALRDAAIAGRLTQTTVKVEIGKRVRWTACVAADGTVLRPTESSAM